jgi:HNH endonuclease
VKIETDHIVPAESGGSDHIENAIPVCFECHAEIHSYNDKHPRGRKFQPQELQLHRDQWLKICSERPELLIGNWGRPDLRNFPPQRKEITQVGLFPFHPHKVPVPS